MSGVMPPGPPGFGWGRVTLHVVHAQRRRAKSGMKLGLQVKWRRDSRRLAMITG